MILLLINIDTNYKSNMDVNEVEILKNSILCLKYVDKNEIYFN